MSSDREYISDLKVKYGDSLADAPPNALRELTGQSSNVNHKFGGKHAWLVPTYTTDPNAAATSLHVVVQTIADAKSDDLAKGCGGGYRYMFSKADPDVQDKITYAALLRSSTSITETPPGWDMITTDINKGRRRSHLYIVARTAQYANKSFLSLPVPSIGGFSSVRSSLNLSAEQKEYVEMLQVVSGDNRDDVPADCVRDVTGADADINFQGGGKYVWLVPKYTTDPIRAATSFDVLIQSFEDPKLDDIAKGAGGDFRYVVPRADRKLAEKIVSVALYRSGKPVSRPPAGWSGYAINDLNKARKKGCGGLYLVWKTANVNSWSFVSLTSISSFKSANTNQFIKCLKVCYGENPSDMPEDVVYEYDGKSADINHQFGGKYVWLVPEFTVEANSAACSFEVSTQSIADLASSDLAKGAHRGDLKFRYIVPVYNPNSRMRVREVQLLRSDNIVTAPPSGWHGMTKDINSGRQKTCLYLIWKTVSI